MPPPLPPKLKKAATDAFQDNALLVLISPEDRVQAACWYEEVAGQLGGSRVGLARLYNLERARFLRGQFGHIAPNAPAFGREIGYQDRERNLVFKFQEGETVALVSDESMSRFRAGDQGVVWAQYTTEPPAYEVNFQDAEGREYGAIMYEHELAAVSAVRGGPVESYAKSAA